ncbi:zinc finger protein 668-like [Frankliniella occidentalis]|uniref:Zinc finger protein 668-like n=1 Tax=Frankliniella occidentalis TaxID=133901 RepID=A0A9C6X6N5_FRAOC|nr:zinc finger protein 668-like [Frankliniella occidentalis]
MFPDEDLHWQHYRTHVTEPCEEVRQDVVEEDDVQPPPSYQCKMCSETFSDERSHWLHYKVHAQLPASDLYEIVKPANGMTGQYRCSRCLELFADLEGHWWHFRAHYQQEELAQLDALTLTDNCEEGGTETTTSLKFKCSQCPELFQDDRSRWWHYRVHAADSSNCFEMVRSRPEYRCIKCSQVFPDVANHWLHYRTHYPADVFDLVVNNRVNGAAAPSPSEKQFRCSKCPELFQDVDAHWEHYRQHYASPDDRPCFEAVDVDKDANEKTTTYRCSKCDQMSDDLEAHWWHYRSHMDVTEDVELDQTGIVTFRCLECAETFPDSDSHWAHYRQHVDAEVCEEIVPQDLKPKLYPCSKCSEVFPDRRSRFLHCAVHVTPRRGGPGPSQAVLVDKSKGLQCNACSEIFLDTESHWWHYKTVHKPDAEQVGPETYQIVELTADPTEDPSTKRCQCSKCPETFPDRKAHHRHYKAVHAGGLE